jgi:biotin carboxylase
MNQPVPSAGLARQTVLLVGNYRQTIAAVRSLAAAGHRPIVGLAGESEHAERSRYASGTWEHPPLGSDPTRFLAALIDGLARRRDIGWVFPMGDAECRCLAGHLDAVRPLAGVVMPGCGAVASCLDKVALLRVADNLGVPQAGFARASSTDELVAAADAAGYPCIVKPVHSPARLLGRKAVIVTTRAGLHTTFARWPAEHETLLVESYVTGLRHNVHFAAHRGQLVGRLHGVTLRTNCVDGTGINTEGISVTPSSRLVDYTERITRHLDYTGVGVTQFIVDDATGDAVFLELNPRLPVNTAFGMRCGLDLPVMALALAAGLAVAPLDGRTGIRYAWTSGDLEAWLAAVRGGDVSRREALRWLVRIGLAAIRADVHGTWQWNDPGPTWALVAGRWRTTLRKS